jgi:hypothetical protein
MKKNGLGIEAYKIAIFFSCRKEAPCYAIQTHFIAKYYEVSKVHKLCKSFQKRSYFRKAPSGKNFIKRVALTKTNKS